MKRIFSNYKSYIVCLIVIVGAIVIVNTMKNSYAAVSDSAIDKSNVISSTFSTNYTSTNVNYIGDAGASAEFKSIFATPKSLKTSDNKKALYLFIKNQDIATNEKLFEHLQDNPTKINDRGLSYIIAHGYNEVNNINTVFTNSTYKNSYGTLSDAVKQQYVTQMAIWLYVYKNKSSFTDYCKNGACDFSTSNGTAIASLSANEVTSLIETLGKKTDYKWLNYILKLVEEANTYKANTNVDPKMKNLSVDFNLNADYTKLISGIITPVSQSDNSNYMYYSVSIKDENNYGAYIVDEENNKITNMTKMSGSFKVVIPLKEDVTTMNLSSVVVTITGKYVYTASTYAFRVTKDIDKHSNFSDVLQGVETTTTSVSFKAPNFTKISKLDAANGKELPGATLVITKKDNDSFKEEWVSTEEPHYSFLDNGKYQLCETIAPKGYKKKEECIDFEVDGTKVVGVTMKNEVEIENTGATSSKTLIIIGSLVLILGAGTIVLVKKTSKKNAI